MATGCTALQDLKECPVCKEEFTEEFKQPLALPCDHLLCQICIDQIKNGIQIKCPVCTTLHKVNKVRRDFRLMQFLDALEEKERNTKNQQKEDEPYCQICSLEGAHHWCKDCKKWLCSGCNRSHPNIPTCENHTTEPLSSKIQEIKSRYQSEAKTIKAKMQNHTSAANSIEDTIREFEMTQIEALAESNDIRSKCIDDINKYFDTIDDKIMAFTQDQISPLQRNHNDLLFELSELKIKWNQLEQMITEDTRKLVVDGQAILDEAKQINDFFSGLNMQYDDISIKVIPGSKWKPTSAALLKMTGGAKMPLGASPKLPSQPKLNSIVRQQFTRSKEIDLPSRPNFVRLIDDKLWIGMNSRVDIFDLNLKRITTWNNDAWRFFYDVVGLPDRSFVLVCYDNMFHVDSNGKVITEIDYGYYKSGAYHDGKLHVYNYKSNSIMIYAYDRAWKKQARLPLPFGQGPITLSITDATITVCSYKEHKLCIMNHAGQVLNACGTYGKNLAGELNHPYLCQEDEDGVMLVADNLNKRLQILDEKRKWSIVNMEPIVRRPVGAVYANGVFYVLSELKKLYIYI